MDEGFRILANKVAYDAADCHSSKNPTVRQNEFVNSRNQAFARDLDEVHVRKLSLGCLREEDPRPRNRERHVAGYDFVPHCNDVSTQFCDLRVRSPGETLEHEIDKLEVEMELIQAPGAAVLECRRDLSSKTSLTFSEIGAGVKDVLPGFTNIGDKSL